MIKQCAWCNRINIVTKDGRSMWLRYIPKLHNKVSHGLCPSCLQRYFPEIYKEVSVEKLLNRAWQL